MKMFLISTLAWLLIALPARAGQVAVGSKAFTEGFLLAELAAQEIESTGTVDVGRRFGLGGSSIVYEAIKGGEIDVCPDYIGSIADLLLRAPKLSKAEDVDAQLRRFGLAISKPLGFENVYGFAVTRAFSRTHDVTRISDLKKLSGTFRAGFSHEFCGRADGLASVRTAYGILRSSAIEPIDHVLAYRAIAAGKVDVIDVYSTDSRIDELDLVLLQDDLEALPHQQATYLVRTQFIDRYPAAWAKLQALGGRLDQKQMRQLNAQVDRDHVSAATAVRHYRGQSDEGQSRWPALGGLVRRTNEHLLLVAAAIAISIFIGIPLGVVAAHSARVGRVVLLVASLIQTIPSLALLSLLIPLFGVGMLPAMVALCLYSLLPVVSSTCSGLQGISADLLDTASVLGLSRWSILFRVQLPLASRSILTGLRTAIITSIGTATLAALIGAGGYGAAIVAGLALNDRAMVLSGAIPAAVMALLAHLILEALTYVLIPRGMTRAT